MAKWNEVGSINKSKAGKLYIALKPQKAKDGSFDYSGIRALGEALLAAGEQGIALQLEKPEDEILRLAELGYIKEDDVESRIEAIPEWIRQKIKFVAD